MDRQPIEAPGLLAQQIGQLGDMRRNPLRLVFGEQLSGCTTRPAHPRIRHARATVRLVAGIEKAPRLPQQRGA